MALKKTSPEKKGDNSPGFVTNCKSSPAEFPGLPLSFKPLYSSPIFPYVCYSVNTLKWGIQYVCF